MVIEEHARLEILIPNETNWRHISENDIIQNSLSIAEKCMEDSSFSLGGVNSGQLTVKIRLQGTNSFNIIGSKINVFSWFGDEETAINDKTVRFRGVFWVTSATKINDIYTISASDAMTWLDSVNYNNDGDGSNPIYNELSSYIRNLNNCFKVIIEQTNYTLNGIIELKYIDNNIIINNNHNVGYCLLPSDMVGEISTRNPRDYVSWIAELACGFAYVYYKQDGFNEPYVQGGDHEPYIKIGQFGEETKNEILWEEIELNSCEIADFTVQINGIWTDVYDGTGGGIGDCKGGVVIDISDNPFKDGHWQYNNRNCMDILENIVGKIWGGIPNCNGLKFRPFKLKCHGKKHFGLGQKIKLPDGRFSVVTSIKWQFRGGTNLTCAGKDSRLLSVSAKRSQAAKVKDLAYTKINRLQRQIDDIREQI